MAASTFTFTTFKAVMGIDDIPEATYAFILRAVFEYVNTVHEINIDDYQSQPAADGTTTSVDIPVDLQLALFSHAKYLYETQVSNSDIVAQAKDAGGNTVVYQSKKQLPANITSTYRMYSQTEPVIL